MCAGKALGLPEVSVLLLWLLGRATGAVTVAGGTLLSLFLELSLQIIPKSLLCCLQSHCVFLAKHPLGNGAAARGHPICGGTASSAPGGLQVLGPELS